MARYIRKPIVVEAMQLNADADLGDLGLMQSGDWLLGLVNGNLVTMDDAKFTLLYQLASPGIPLTGTVYD